MIDTRTGGKRKEMYGAPTAFSKRSWFVSWLFVCCGVGVGVGVGVFRVGVFRASSKDEFSNPSVTSVGECHYFVFCGGVVRTIPSSRNWLC
jgi:hypothetical protein